MNYDELFKNKSIEELQSDHDVLIQYDDYHNALIISEELNKRLEYQENKISLLNKETLAKLHKYCEGFNITDINKGVNMLLDKAINSTDIDYMNDKINTEENK